MDGAATTSEMRHCRRCGCNEYDACISEYFTPCHWVEDDLCSECHRAGRTLALPTHVPPPKIITPDEARRPSLTPEEIEENRATAINIGEGVRAGAISFREALELMGFDIEEDPHAPTVE